jgi:hypothetical protein
MVACDDPHHVLGLLLQEFDAALSARRQVITIRKVEAITEIFLQLVDVLGDIMNHIYLHLLATSMLTKNGISRTSVILKISVPYRLPTF